VSGRGYFRIDARSLALFRAGLGLCAFAEVSERLLELEAHYTDFGVLPRHALVGTRRVLSPYMMSGSHEFVLALMLLTLLAAACLILGRFTRTATIATWALMLSLTHRAPLINHAADGLLALLLTWGMFLPLGATWSLDARRRSSDTATRRTQLAAGPAAIGLVLQPIAVYAGATVSKLQYDSWLEGRAVFALLHKEHYIRPLGEAVRQWPAVAEVATYATIATEAMILVLLASPWKRDRTRALGIALGTGFHLVLYALVDVGIFQPLTIVSALPLLPSSVWERLPATRSGDAEPELLAPDPKPVRWLAAFVLVLSYLSLPASLGKARLNYPEPIATAYYHLLLEQRFRMFANMDATRQGYWIGVGQLHDGRVVDVIELDQTVEMEPPADYAASMPNDNWRQYWSTISQPRYAGLRPYLADYLCRRWNRSARDDQRVERVRVIWVREVVIAPGAPRQQDPQVLVERACAAPNEREERQPR
jgi:hypothetical protein